MSKNQNKQYSKNPFEVVLSNDIEKAATLVYEKNRNYFGAHEMITGDITEISTAVIPDFDFILAGFPCQPFSNALKTHAFCVFKALTIHSLQDRNFRINIKTSLL